MKTEDKEHEIAIQMLQSLEEMNVLIGHLISENVKFYSNDKKQIRNMQELIGKARKHYFKKNNQL